MLRAIENRQEDYQNRDVNTSFNTVYDLAIKHSWVSEGELACLKFDAIITELETMVFISALYQSFLDDEERLITLSSSLEKQITWQLLSLHRIALQSDDGAFWNKVRLTIHNYLNKFTCKFEFKYDSDLDWIESVDQDSDDYLNLSPEEETRIQRWEGLPDNYFRYWLH